MSLPRALPVPELAALKSMLEEIVGPEHVLADPLQLDFYSSDIFDQKKIAALVVQPRTAKQVALSVALCTDADFAVIPRGGGLSYTGGYLPVDERSIIFDLARLDRIVEINAEDMYVTVEGGVTWNELHEALKPLGLRTPYWGTVSGFHATVGGSLSQGSTHFGSGEFGQSADSCLGLEVVVANGTIIKTGSAASIHRPTPFFRTYGPDLTGLFLNDTGALGFKVQATLKLIRSPPHQSYLSFAFERMNEQLAAMAEVSRQRLASECGGWNPALVRRFSAADSKIGDDLKYLAAVSRTGSSLFSGIRDAAKIAIAGRRAWKDEVFLMHVTIDAETASGAQEKSKAVEDIARSFHGRAIPATYPRAHRARPFTDMTQLPAVAERTVPTHGICPHSRALEMAENIYSIFEEHEPRLDSHGISWSLISSTIGTSATLVEPLIHYPDSRGAHYSRIPKGEDLPAAVTAPDEAMLEALRDVRRAVARMFMQNGCAHFQIGKNYPYQESRMPETWALLQNIKDSIDPHGLINPGSLGFERR